jgi:4-diphosphocytidyl-2-C-methyl-D-erythritol kinase
MRLTFDAHAKVNLSLRVLDRLPDGYHVLHTVFQSLELHDTLEVEERPGPFAIECDDPAVPTDARNLVWRAAALAWTAAERPGSPEGARVRLWKRIPAQGGLGGGSTDAAAALAAFGRLWGGGDASSWRALSAKVGADVPFFFCGGTALGKGRGDELTPLADLPAHAAVLVFPPFGVSTAAAYGWLDEDRAAGRGAARADRGVLRLADGSPLTVENDLEPPVAARHPDIARIRESLVRAGARAAAMSGSGSTVFGLFEDPAAAADAVAALRAAGWETRLTRTARRDEALRFLVAGEGCRIH